MKIEEDLLTDIGENYEYIRRIVANSIEIKKIDYSENVAKLLGMVLTILIISSFVIGILVLLFVLGIILLTKALGSIIFAIGIAIGVLVVCVLATWMMRKALFIRPLLRAIYQKLL